MNHRTAPWRDDRGVAMMLVALLLLGAAVAGAVGTYRSLEHQRTVHAMDQSPLLVDRFVEARDEGHRALGQRGPAVFGASAADRLDYLLDGLARAGSSVRVEVSMGLAQAGASPSGSEGSFVEEGTYAVEGLGGNVFEGAVFDGVDDGLVHDEDGALVGVVWFVEARSDRGMLREVGATVWEPNA